MDTRLNGENVNPQIVDSVSNVLGEDIIIKQFRKEVSLWKYHQMAEEIRDSEAKDVSLQIYSISGSIARLLERAFVSDTIRSMGYEVKQIATNIENWYDSLSNQSRQYVSSARAL